MPGAGSYRYRLRRQLASKSSGGNSGSGSSGSGLAGSIVWTDDALLWGQITDTISKMVDGVGAAIIQTDCKINIRNMDTELNPQDRLVDVGTDEIYEILGIIKDFPNNQLIVSADRKRLGRTN